MTSETRRAPAAWSLEGDAQRAGHGLAEAAIDDAGLSVGPVRISFLDADSLVIHRHSIDLALWPAGQLTLSELGRRFETFANELRRARNQARVVGLLAHAPSQPQIFDAELAAAGSASPVEVQVYPTHVTLVPGDADPWQLTFGALQDVAACEDPPSVSLLWAEGPVIVGKLGRRRDALFHAITAARDLHARTLADYTGREGFADGLGLPRSKVTGFEYLLGRCSSPERLSGAKAILTGCKGGEPRIGFVQLLDPDGETLSAKVPLPEQWASFLLVPVGGLVIFELLAGPSAATYVFEGDIEIVNRDLQQLHFRRAGLALSESEAEIAPDNPHRLALRRLKPLRRLRAATRGRMVHDDHWNTATKQLVTAGQVEINSV